MILIGRDALGGWAWMLLDAAGGMVESGQCLTKEESAYDAGADAWAEARIRGQHVGPKPAFVLIA